MVLHRKDRFRADPRSAVTRFVVSYAPRSTDPLLDAGGWEDSYQASHELAPWRLQVDDECRWTEGAPFPSSSCDQTYAIAQSTHLGLVYFGDTFERTMHDHPVIVSSQYELIAKRDAQVGDESCSHRRKSVLECAPCMVTHHGTAASLHPASLGGCFTGIVRFSDPRHDQLRFARRIGAVSGSSKCHDADRPRDHQKGLHPIDPG